jgi:hypothetical protein
MRMPNGAREVLLAVVHFGERTFAAWGRALEPEVDAERVNRYLSADLTDAERAALDRARSDAPVWSPDSVAPHLKERVAHLRDSR